LTESQRSFEATLAAIRATEGEISDALERARAAEARAADQLRTAEDERRRARRERDEQVRTAREEAERIVAELRDELAASRRALERETVTAASIDASLARADAAISRLPAAPQPEREPATGPAQPRSWRVGDRARSRSGGWEGRVAALERGGRRATLEAGGMRVVVEVSDLVPGTAVADSTPRRADAGGSSGAAALRLAKARTVASSLDLRGARVEEALDALGRYLDDAAVAGLSSVTIIHGLGTGALRDAVRAAATDHPLVRETRPGQRGEGGDGATIVSL
jgi:DNA mismatch repair protein MutS2